MMQLKDLLAYFDQGGSFGDDPEILASMRTYIQENRRLLFEMNHLWHEDEREITELFTRITAKPVGQDLRIETPFYTDFGKTSRSAATCLSTPAASSRIRAGSSLVMGHSSAIIQYWPH